MDTWVQNLHFSGPFSPKLSHGTGHSHLWLFIYFQQSLWFSPLNFYWLLISLLPFSRTQLPTHFLCWYSNYFIILESWSALFSTYILFHQHHSSLVNILPVWIVRFLPAVIDCHLQVSPSWPGIQWPAPKSWLWPSGYQLLPSGSRFSGRAEHAGCLGYCCWRKHQRLSLVSVRRWVSCLSQQDF